MSQLIGMHEAYRIARNSGYIKDQAVSYATMAAIVAEAVSSMALSQMFFSHMVTDALFWLIVGYTFYYIDLENNKAKEPEKIAGKAE